MGQKMGIGLNGLPYIEFGGHRRYLGSLKPTRSYAHLPLFSQSHPVIDPSQWEEFEDPDDDLPILDQNGHGSCVGHGSITAFQCAWSHAGNPFLQFSANFLYGLVNGGSDNGAVVGDAMDALLSKGSCLEKTIPEGNIIYERQFPKEAYVEAGRFMAEKTFRLSTFNEIGTAVQLRRGVSIGIQCGNAFETDQAGVLHNQVGGGGGHCLCVARGAKRINGQWYLKVRNSWGKSWGRGGTCWMNSTYFGRSDTDHFVIQTPKVDPQGINPPIAA